MVYLVAYFNYINMPMLNNTFRYAAVQKITGEIHIETVSLIPARILTHVVKMPNAKQTVILQKINLIQTSLIDWKRRYFHSYSTFC